MGLLCSTLAAIMLLGTFCSGAITTFLIIVSLFQGAFQDAFQLSLVLVAISVILCLLAKSGNRKGGEDDK